MNPLLIATVLGLLFGIIILVMKNASRKPKNKSSESDDSDDSSEPTKRRSNVRMGVYALIALVAVILFVLELIERTGPSHTEVLLAKVGFTEFVPFKEATNLDPFFTVVVKSGVPSDVVDTNGKITCWRTANYKKLAVSLRTGNGKWTKPTIDNGRKRPSSTEVKFQFSEKYKNYESRMHVYVVQLPSLYIDNCGHEIVKAVWSTVFFVS